MTLEVLEGHVVAVNGVAWSPDGGDWPRGMDNTVRVWDATTGTSLAVLEGHALLVLSVAWSPDGARLASASDDGTVQVWDIW